MTTKIALTIPFCFYLFFGMQGVQAAIDHADIKEGSVAIYSNGQVEKLIQRSHQGTLWEDARKRRYLKSQFPFYPLVKYERFPDSAGGYEQRLIKGAPEQLKPYGHKDKVHLVLVKTKADGTRKEINWRCLYKGESAFQLQTVNYATTKFHCDRVSYPNRRIRETLLIEYSPKLDLIVGLSKTKKDRTRHHQLVTLLAKEQATPDRITAEVKKIKKNK